MSKLSEVIKIAEIHASRIKEALEELELIFPITETILKDLSKENRVWIDIKII